MSLKRFGSAAVIALTLAGATVATVQPADAWCRFGRCGFGWRGGYGWRGYGYGPGAVAAGVLAGAAVGTAVGAAAAAGPGPYYGRGYGPGPGGYYACPPGYHFGPGGRSCFAN